MNITMKDRVAVVTGGSKGIGVAVARRFAESGAKVAIVARGAPDLKAAREQLARDGLEVRDYVCDVSKADQIQQTYDAVIKAFGKVDILINNAGQSMAMPAEQITDEIWRDDLELKLFAAIRLTRLVWPGMKQRKWGRIINVLNTGAKAPRANGAPTAVSRAAGMAFMKVLASEGAPHGILVNGMLVGQIVSDQVARRHAREGTNVPFEEYIATVGKGIPVGRMGKAEEFAAMACFLCSDHAGFTTGTAINMDGGASPVV